MPSKRGAQVVPHPAAGADSPSDQALCVDIAQIECYERDPRQCPNPEYDRIRASILTAGLDQPLLITRRPDERHYIVYGGGNTRLRILKELYATTGDERFFRVPCHYVEWQQESTVLLAHLRENDLRGDLTFIDKARAVLNFKTLIVDERRNRDLSHRQLAKILKEQGYPVSHVSVTIMDYAVSTLLPAMPLALAAGLGRPQVERIRSLQRVAATIWDRRALGEAAEFLSTFQGLCRRHDGLDWQFDSLRQAVENELAEAADTDIQLIRMEAECRLGGREPEVPEFLLTDDTADCEQLTVGEGVGADAAAAGPADSTEERSAEYLQRTRPGPLQEACDAGSEMQLIVELRHCAEASDGCDPDQPRVSGGVSDERLRRGAFSLAQRLAGRHGFADLVAPAMDRGAGFVVCEQLMPSQTERLSDAQRVLQLTLWWQLVAFAEMPSAPLDVVSELSYPDSALRRAVSAGDWTGLAQSMVTPGLAELGIAFWGPLGDEDWRDWLSLASCYRTLRSRLAAGHRSLWDAPPC